MVTLLDFIIQRQPSPLFNIRFKKELFIYGVITIKNLNHRNKKKNKR